MKQQNRTIELKDLCEDFKKDIVDGPFGSNLKRSDYKKTGIPVLKIQNVKPFKIVFKKMDFVGEDKFEELNRHSYKQGDIIMTKLGDPLGASAIVEDTMNGLIVADLVRIRANKVNTKYLCYHLNSPKTQEFINSKQKGTTRPRVRISDVRELPIFSPPLPEQQRIVEILDQSFAAIDQAIENTEKNMVHIEVLKDLIFNKTIEQPLNTSKFFSLRNICEIIIDCEHKTAPTQSKGYPSVRTSNIGKGKLILDKINFVSEQTYKFWTRRGAPKEGDLIFAREAPAGNVAVIPNGLTICLGQRTVLIRPKKEIINSNFLMYLLLSNNIQNRLLSQSKGATVLHVNMKDIRNLEIPSFPSLSEQVKISEKIDWLFNSIEIILQNYQQKRSRLLQLKQSILHKAFNGEL
jgi:type I restriction enzyme S subunit